MTFHGLAAAGFALAAASISCQPSQPPQDAQTLRLREEIAHLRTQIAELKADFERAPGYPRWRIEFRTGVRADTYLLDTATGRVWREYVDPKSKDYWWAESRVEDRLIPDEE